MVCRRPKILFIGKSISNYKEAQKKIKELFIALTTTVEKNKKNLNNAVREIMSIPRKFVNCIGQ